MDERTHVDSLRREVASEIARVEAVLGTQIGAVEKTLTAKLDGLKWKILGGVLAQVVAAIGVLIGTRHSDAATAAARALVRAAGLR